MFKKLSISDIDVKGKKVLVRVDFNVPLDENRQITDNSRIVKSLPTIKYILKNGGAVIAMSHLGRPKGKKSEKFSLKPVALELARLLEIPVTLAPDCVGFETAVLCNKLFMGEVILLENLRFHSEEKANGETFAREISCFGDLLVNDAFGACHRAHASIAGIPKFLRTAMGFLLEKELKYFGKALTSPNRPFVAITGGAKVSDKIPVLENLVEVVDSFIIAGGMCYTFLSAMGASVGSSLIDKDRIELARTTMSLAEKAGVKILLPIDHVIADSFSKDAKTKIVDGDIPDGWMALDIGPKTVELFSNELKNAGTVVWNGPLGVFEMPPFATGTREIALVLADSSATTILGGGDTGAAASLFDVSDKMSHVSTGGGASLELLQGKTLPGVSAISNK